jgi:hypothetical protein
MNKEKLMELIAAVWLALMGCCLAAIICKLTYDFMHSPNVFAKEEPKQSQQKIDEMCVTWWFESNLVEAKKRVCGK